MQIWLIIEDQEIGPYAREEVFKLLSASQISEETPSRVEGSDEVVPVRDALKERRGLFSVAQILSQQQEFEVAPRAVIDLGGRAAATRASRPETKPERHPLRGAAVILVILGAAGYLWLQQSVTRFASADPEDRAPTVQTPSTGSSSGNLIELDGLAPSDAIAGSKEGESIPLGIAAGTAANSEPSTNSSPIDKSNMLDAPAMPEVLPSRTDRAMLAGPTITGDKSGISAMGEQELMAILAERFSAHPVKLFPDGDAGSQERKGTFIGSFELETPLKWNPKVRVRYRVPQTKLGRPTPGADQMVMVCLWHGAAAPPKYKSAAELPPPPAAGANAREHAKTAAAAAAKDPKGVDENQAMQGHMRTFSDNLGFTAFTFEIVTDPTDWTNTKEAYYYAGAEWVDLVQRARAEIMKRHHLQAKKLLLYGVSQGGTFAERLAVAMGDQIAGVATQNAPEVTLPNAPTNAVWFVGVTRGDAGGQENAHLAHDLRALGTNCIYLITPPAYGQRGVGNLYHSVSPEARQASLLFLEAVARLETGAENKPTKWPFIRDANQPLSIKQNGVEIAKQIPVTRREYLPSREFVHVMETLPPPAQFVTLDSSDPEGSRCMVGVPPLGKPKGIILLDHKYQFTDLPQLMNNLNFLAEKGYVVLAPRLRGDSQKTIQRTLAFITRNRGLSSLPISFVGVGSENEPLWKLLIAQHRINPCLHVAIDFRSGKLLNEATWPLGSRFTWPVLFLFDQNPEASSTSPGETVNLASDLKAINTFVDGLRGRNQIAAVRTVPASVKTAEHGAQKAIETALEFINASVEGKLRTRFQ